MEKNIMLLISAIVIIVIYVHLVLNVKGLQIYYLFYVNTNVHLL